MLPSLLLTFFLLNPAATDRDVHEIASRASVSTNSPGKANLSKLASVNLNDSLTSLYHAIRGSEAGLSYEAFRYGMIGFFTLKHEGRLQEKNVLTIIDFTKASTEKRFYTIDLDRQSIIYHTYVSHGKNTGENLAKSFSNVVHSNQSSLGFYITAETYVGSKGYSLKLDGVEAGYNDNMRTRAVVVHEADYVSENWIRKYGRLGRSQGCPALPKELSRTIINEIRNGTLMFSYFNDEQYLLRSSYLDMDKLLDSIGSQPIVHVPEILPPLVQEL